MAGIAATQLEDGLFNPWFFSDYNKRGTAFPSDQRE